MHKNTVNKTATAHANVAVSRDGNNAKRAHINIVATVNNTKKARLRWQPVAMASMLGKHILIKW